jgi:hypothetical protein
MKQERGRTCCIIKPPHVTGTSKAPVSLEKRLWCMVRTKGGTISHSQNRLIRRPNLHDTYSHRGYERLSKYPTAYGIHPYRRSISRSRLNSLQATLIAKNGNFRYCWPNSNSKTKGLSNFCERCVMWYLMAFLKMYYIPFGCNEGLSVSDATYIRAKERSWPNRSKLLTGSLITWGNLKS